MPGRPSGAISLLARLADVEPKTYRNWQAEGLVNGPRSAEGTELDVVEACALALVLSKLGDSDGRIAWKEVGAVIVATIPIDAFRLVWNIRYYSAVICHDDIEVIHAVEDGESVRVISLGNEVSRALEAFRRRSKALGGLGRKSRRPGNQPVRRRAFRG